MENKCKRFLSLLLALVMVIGLMPVGHAHAEEAKSYNTVQITHDKITGSASSWVNDSGEDRVPEQAFDGVINAENVNNNFWHSNTADAAEKVYLIGILDEKSMVSKVVYHRRGASDGTRYNGRVTKCEIFVTTDAVPTNNGVTTVEEDGGLTWISVGVFENLPADASNELVFNAPAAATAVKMVVHTTTFWSSNNKAVTCGELEIWKAVCENDNHTYTDCEDTECNDCFAVREAPGHTEESIPAVDPTFDSTGLTAGVRCSVCGATLTAQDEVPMLSYNADIVPLNVLNVTAGDWETDGGASEGPAELVKDDNFGTLWHTDWYGNEASKANHWIQFELTAPYNVNGLRYKPRTDGKTNGTITSYDIQVSHDGVNFTSVKTGTWENNTNWKVAEFDAQNVKYVRLVSLEAVTDNDSFFASASEIRLVGISADHAHEFTSEVTTPATLQSPGVKTHTCGECDTSYTTEIPQLTAMNAKVLTGSTILALSECEYVLGGTEGAYSLCHGGNYYVNLRENGVNCNQTTNASAYLNLDWDDYSDGRVSIWQNTSRLGYLYFHYGEATLKWDVNGSLVTDSNGQAGNQTGFYLLYADEDSTNQDIPGYTVANAAYVAEHIEDGESYLIAIKNSDNKWYVVVPAVTGGASACIARVDVLAEGESVHTHEYTTTSTQDATCTDTGLITNTCTCNHAHKTVIPATGNHTWVDADCDTPKTCSVCGETEGTALGHTPMVDAAVAPDCENTGLTEGSHCSVCGEVIVAQTVVNALGHTPVVDAAVAPDCENTGLTEGSHCSVCGEVIVAQTVVNALGHDYKDVYTDPDFGKDGYTTYTCTKCGDSYIETNAGSAKVAIAQIGDDKYESLPEAVAAAKDNDTVTLLQSTTGAGVVIDKDITIDLGTYTYAFNEGVGSKGTESNGFQILKGNDVTIQNGTLEIAEDAAGKFYTVIQNYANLTLNNVTVDATNADKWSKTDGDSYAVSINSGDVKFLGNTTIKANNDGDKAFAFDVYDNPNYVGAPTVTVDASVVITGKVDAAAKIGNVYYATFEAALDADGEIELLVPVTVDSKVSYNLSGETITSAGDAFVVVKGGELTLNGDGVVKAGTSNKGSWTAVWANGGNVVINGGTYSVGGDTNATDKTHQNDLIYTKNSGTVTINGGTFKYTEGVWTLNQKDANQAEAGGAITVYGGTFEKFNPANNASEGAGTSFVATGYAALKDLNGSYVVGAAPTATVNNLREMTIPAGEYLVYPSGDTSKDMPLSFVMQFLADQDAEDMKTSPFADWYGDFVLTFTGIENGSFKADGCYLAGYYGDFGWVKVPVDGMIIEDGARYPVMLGFSEGQKYEYICSGVKDFRCALYLTPEILAANPNLEVSLELSVVDNSQGSEAAAGALADTTMENVNVVGETEYKAEDFKIYVAQVGGTKFETFEAALNAAKNGEDNTVTLLKPVEVTETTTYDISGVTIQSAGDAFIATNGATLTLEGDGEVKAGTSGVGSWTAVWANGGNVIINGGTYSVGGDTDATDKTHQNDAIYTKNGGTVVINGGTFLYTDGVWTLNENDANRGTITVKGGTFHKWNPENNVSEGAGTSFLAPGYMAVTKDNGATYTVVEYTTYTWIVDGEILSTVKVAKNDPAPDANSVEAPAKDGFEFVEWTTSEDGKTFTAVYEAIVVETAKVVMQSMNVLLEDEIKLTYTVAIPEELVNNGATVVLTKVGGYETVVKEYTGESLISCKNNAGNYVVEMGVASGEMTCPITIEAKAADGTALVLYGTSNNVLDTPVAYSVVDYARIILNGKYSDNLKALAKAMVVYGGYAQTNFNTFTDALAYKELNIVPDLSGVTAETVDQYKSTQSNANMGVVANGINTHLDSSIYMRVYMKVDGDISDYTFTLMTPSGSKLVTPVADGERYYVDITGIASGYIDYEYTIAVSNGTETNEITTSVLSYVRTVLNGNYDAKLQNLAKALYLYNQAANANWPDR